MKTTKLTCAKARDISIIQVLTKLGYAPKRITENQSWYLSPFRDEKTASFKVDLNLNRWYDHGSGKGGNVIDFLLQKTNNSIPEILKYLTENINSLSFHQQADFVKTKKNYEIFKMKNLDNKALLDYLTSRKINVEIAQTYCKEIYYKMNNKNFFAIGFQNNSKGFEIRNKYFKGCLDKKDFTWINNKSNQVQIFEGFFDFLSYLSSDLNIHENSDFIILNSVTLINKIDKILTKYKTINCYFDNDAAGNKAMNYITTKFENSQGKSFLFHPYKDLNDYLINVSVKKASGTRTQSELLHSVCDARQLKHK